jgi:hypothetical protein
MEDAGMNFYLLPLSEYKWVWGFTHYESQVRSGSEYTISI